MHPMADWLLIETDPPTTTLQCSRMNRLRVDALDMARRPEDFYFYLVPFCLLLFAIRTCRLPRPRADILFMFSAVTTGVWTMLTVRIMHAVLRAKWRRLLYNIICMAVLMYGLRPATTVIVGTAHPELRHESLRTTVYLWFLMDAIDLIRYGGASS